MEILEKIRDLFASRGPIDESVSRLVLDERGRIIGQSTGDMGREPRVTEIVRDAWVGKSGNFVVREWRFFHFDKDVRGSQITDIN